MGQYNRNAKSNADVSGFKKNNTKNREDAAPCQMHGKDNGAKRQYCDMPAADAAWSTFAVGAES